MKRLKKKYQAILSLIRLFLRTLSLPLVRHLRMLWWRRMTPLYGGAQIGTPIVRYYWDQFMHKHAEDVKGVGLEIGMTQMLEQWGKGRLTQAVALDLEPHADEVKLVANLDTGEGVPENEFDCFINSFSLHLIPNAECALYNSVKLLKSGGVLLANFSCVDYFFDQGLDMGTGKPLFVHHAFTPLQVVNWVRRLGLEEVEIEVYGNYFTRLAYTANMASEELTSAELNQRDAGFPVLIGLRAKKPVNWQPQVPVRYDLWEPQTAGEKLNPLTFHYPARYLGIFGGVASLH